jgi:hypothetical protein
MWLTFNEGTNEIVMYKGRFHEDVWSKMALVAAGTAPS